MSISFYPIWTGCHKGVYGLECSKNCSSRNCLDSMSPCHDVNGRCTKGCKPEWDGVDCMDESKHLHLIYG